MSVRYVWLTVTKPIYSTIDRSLCTVHASISTDPMCFSIFVSLQDPRTVFITPSCTTASRSAYMHRRPTCFLSPVSEVSNLKHPWFPYLLDIADQTAVVVPRPSLPSWLAPRSRSPLGLCDPWRHKLQLLIAIEAGSHR